MIVSLAIEEILPVTRILIIFNGLSSRAYLLTPPTSSNWRMLAYYIQFPGIYDLRISMPNLDKGIGEMIPIHFPHVQSVRIYHRDKDNSQLTSKGKGISCVSISTTSLLS